MKSKHFIKIHTIVQVCPTVMWFDDQLISIQNCKSIDNVCAKVGVYVTRKVFTNALPARTNEGHGPYLGAL
jgi:hypothetical protein